MSGGLHAKLGDWYEQDYVCFLWLQLLGGHVQAVLWEPAGLDEPGVDGWFKREGRRIAFQCKKRDTGNWTPGKLIKERIPEHVKSHLEREDGPAEFRFVTNAAAPVTRKLRKWAENRESLDRLGTPERDFVQALGITLQAGDVHGRLLALMERFEVHVLGAGPLADQIHVLAKVLVGEQAEDLVRSLRALRSPDILRRELRAADLRKLLPPEFRWRQSVDAAPLLERVESERQKFVELQRRRRRIEPPLERPEVGRLLELLRKEGGSRTLLVHGAAGVGKSDILACAAAEWPCELGVLVPVLAEDAENLVVGELSTKKLTLAAGPGRVTVLIDQLDQLLESGAKTQKLLRNVELALQEARKLGCTVIVGCRTTDAEHDTRLRHLLHADPSQAVEKLEVGDLAEDVVTPVLSRLGVAWNRLGSSVQRLVRRPLALGLVKDLVSTTGWQGSRSLHELVDEWWNQVSKGDVRKNAALDALIECMESEGSLAVDELLLHDHRQPLLELVSDGVLERDSRKRLKPVHQVLVDARLAKQIGMCTTAQQALERIGPRVDQGVAQARRLRHAVTLLANRGQVGAGVLDALWRSSEVRTLVKRAMLLGLREERGELPGPLVRVVRGWLAEPGGFDLLSSTLLYGHGEWVVAVRPWIESTWSGGDENRRNVLLSLLASVAVQQGDLVAVMLESWAKPDKRVLQQASAIFMRDPSQDSEELFRMRLEAPAASALPGWLDWSALLSKNPKRAAALLGKALREKEIVLTGLGPGSRSRSPRAAQFPDSALVAAAAFWEKLRPWWIDLEVGDLNRIRTAQGTREADPIVDLVQILARCLAHLLDESGLGWDELVEDLPSPLRDLDAWLLLETGARLAGRSLEAIEGAAEWLRRNDRFAGLRVGPHGRSSEYLLLGHFLGAIAPHLTEVGYAELEDWILDFREDWTQSDERRRSEDAQRYGAYWPNRRGLLAYRALPALPQSRLSVRARSRLEECRRKFDPVANTMLAPLEFGGGFVGSKLPVHVFLGFSSAEWIERLREAPRADSKPIFMADRVLEYDREMLWHGLRSLSQSNPHRFLPIVEAIATARPALDSRQFEGLLYGLGRAHFEGASSEGAQWKAADDEDLARLASLPAFLENDACAIDLARVVAERSAYDWPIQVVERLCEIAVAERERRARTRIDPDPGVEPLLWEQCSEPDCVALDALAHLAFRHEHHRRRLLDLATRLVDIGPPARRAKAGLLAFWCSATDANRALELLLRACRDPLVAADYQVMRALFTLLDRPSTAAEGREEVVRTLLQLPDSTESHVAARGGQAVVGLRERGLLDDLELRDYVWRSEHTPTGVARELAGRLEVLQTEPWVRGLLLDLAEGPCSTAGEIVLEAVTRPHGRALLRDGEFASRIIASPAGRREREELLRALDAEAHLQPVVEHIFRMVEDMVSDAVSSRSGPDLWSGHEEAQRLGGMLFRLAEECEGAGERATWSKALDALDRLIETRPLLLGPLIQATTS